MTIAEWFIMQFGDFNFVWLAIGVIAGMIVGAVASRENDSEDIEYL